jgi:hypothetical protein
VSWNAPQRAMLEAMGYVVYRPAGGPRAEGAAVREDRSGAATRSAPAASTEGQDTARPMPGGPTQRREQPVAAGGRDPTTLPLPPLDRLRGDAAAKRALWPRLRALRRH